jgi:hypothetical protein
LFHFLVPSCEFLAAPQSKPAWLIGHDFIAINDNIADIIDAHPGCSDRIFLLLAPDER